MKQDQVEIGGTYIAKVSDRLVPVRIEGKHQHGGWYAVNMRTGKTIRIKSAQRLRGPAMDQKRSPQERSKANGSTPAAKPTPKPQSPDAGEAVATQAATKAKAPKEKKPTGLDAAAQVLAEAKEPMRCGDIVQKMLERGLWSTGGATPVATISAAIQREIKTKGEQSRFKKADRGLFTLNGK